MLRAGWFQRQPEQLADELRQRPIDLRQHVEANDVEPQQTGRHADHASPAQVDRADLCVAQPPGEVRERRRAGAVTALDIVFHGHAHFGLTTHLHLGEDVLIFEVGHQLVPPATTGALVP